MSRPRVWFITGASSGFGRLLAELILSKGEIAVATARRPSALDDLKAKHPSDHLLVVKLDVDQPQEIITAFAEVKKAFGRIDVVVNNAAWATFGEVEGAQDKDVRAMFETNFWGAANVSREAVRFFRDANAPGAGGLLLQISSVTGIVGVPAGGYYAATKFAFEGLTEALASELDPAGGIHRSPSSSQAASRQKAREKSSGPQSTLRMRPTRSCPPPRCARTLGKDSVTWMKQKATSLLAAAEKYEYLSEDLELSK